MAAGLNVVCRGGSLVAISPKALVMLTVSFVGHDDLPHRAASRAKRTWYAQGELVGFCRPADNGNASGRIGHVPARSTTGPTREKECLQRTDLMETFGVA